MENVLISQSKKIYSGTVLEDINTQDVQYGYYSVPLDVRNKNYPTEFANLPAAQVCFAVIDDEIPLYLGDKIDCKDYIKIVDNNGGQHYAIVNPITRDELEKDKSQYSTLKKSENGGIHPPPVSNYKLGSSLPKPLKVGKVITINILQLKNSQSQMTIPVLIPIELNAQGFYTYPNIQIARGTQISFQLIQYQNAMRNGIHLAAYLILNTPFINNPTY